MILKHLHNTKTVVGTSFLLIGTWIAPVQMSGAPDWRWDDGDLRTLRSLKGSDFEVVRMGTVQSR